jgi:hypothetical protein
LIWINRLAQFFLPALQILFRKLPRGFNRECT